MLPRLASWHKVAEPWPPMPTTIVSKCLQTCKTCQLTRGERFLEPEFPGMEGLTEGAWLQMCAFRLKLPTSASLIVHAYQAFKSVRLSTA